jgi:hypothetical protein
MNASTRRRIAPALIISLFASFLPAIFAASGPPAVTVTQPVDVVVKNPDTAPVQVQDVDNPAFQPFQREFIFTFPAGFLGDNEDFTVPAGKRLVIEFVSFRYHIPAGQTPALNFLQIGNVSYYFSMTQQAANQPHTDGPQDLWVGTSPTRLYVNPGVNLRVAVRKNSAVGTGLGSVSISGYYVNAP